MIAMAVLMASFVVVAPRVQADGGDFSLDFVASAPETYNHATGGGAFDDRTVGVNKDIVESLEGGDFTCGDTVTYLLRIVNTATPSHANQSAAFHMSFLADTTGQSGAAHSAVTNVKINYGPVSGGDGPGGIDSGITDNGNSTVSWSSSLNGALFTKNATVELDFTVNNLEAGEKVVVRVDTTLACDPGSRPTGNLQAALTGARVVSEDGNAVNKRITSGSGNQTIPFKHIGELIVVPQPGEIVVIKQTLPDGASQLFDFDSSWGGFQLGDGHTTTSGPLDAGTYFVDETVAEGWTLLSATCDDGSSIGTINVAEGEVVRCTFVNELIPLIPAYVTVLPGTCEWINGQSVTRISFDVDEGATLTIKLGDTVIGVFAEDGFVDVQPGEYSWVAVADQGYEIASSDKGTFTAIDCEVPKETVTVDIDLGPCVWNGQESLTSVTASINPSGAAIITIDDSESMKLSFDGQSINVGPGQHSWSAEVVDPETYVLEGNSSGNFTTEACPPLGSIGDRVWHDLNANGIQDEGEPGIEGVEVSLFVGGGVIDTDVTDVDGNYLFDELAADEYSVAFTVTEPWVATVADAGADGVDSDIDADGKAPAVVLAIGENNLTVDAGLVLPSTITVEKVTEPATEGTFTFSGDIEGDLANGESASSTVLPGTYSVVEALPEGWALIDITCDAGGSGDVATATATYTVTSGDEITCTFTNTNVGSVIIEKTTDTPTADVFTFTIGEEVIELASGDSIELDLPSGIYTITEDVLLVDGWDLASIVCSGESDVDGNSVSLYVPPAQTVGCTFVNTEAEIPLGIIGDFVWNDTDGDGVQDAGESGASNVGVDLLGSESGEVLFSTTTNAAGVYVIANVPEGDYVVQFSVPEPWVFAPANAGGNDSLDSDVTEIVEVSAGASGLLNGASTIVLAAGGTVGRTGAFFVPAGATDMTIDAGIFEVLVLPEPPVTNPETPTVTTPATPSTPPVVDDTKVAGIQTTLPQTGFADWQAGMLAIALMLGGAGVLLAFRRKEDIVYMTSGFGNRLGS